MQINTASLEGVALCGVPDLCQVRCNPAMKPASAFSRGAATECSPGRKPGVGVVLECSPRGAKDSEDFLAPTALRWYRKKSPGSRPGLHSVAAPRLAVAAYFGHFAS